MKYSMIALVAVCAAGVTNAKADTLYLGVHGGFGSLNDDWTLQGAGTWTGTGTASGAVAGIQGGWEHPFQGGAIGAEADLSFLDLNSGFDGFEGIGVNASLLSSLRVRALLSNGPIRPFLTAGVGLGDLKYTEEGTFYGSSGNFVNQTKIGFVFGGGLDAKLSDQWTGRLEGLYYAFGNDSGSFSDTRTYSVNSNVFVVRAGLSYSFGP